MNSSVIMPIFSIEKGVLKEVSQKLIVLEKDVQGMVEKNLDTIFKLEFVTSEFQLHELRVDSLGFDVESKSFVIIEYKRDKNISVIDQGYAYLALLLNNKAEFILVYNEMGKRTLRKNDVDWTQSRVIFISPYFTTYQRKAIDFKDLPIELWEVKLYSNNTILFNQIRSAEQSESVKKISQKSEVVRAVNQEVKVFTEDDHFQGSSDMVYNLYKELKGSVLSISADINIKPKAKYIAFIHKTNFVDMVLRKSHLVLFLNMKKGLLNDPQKIARDISNIGHWGNGDYEVKLKEPKDIGYVLSLIRQSYEVN
jgi:predicted transport protein